MRTFSPRLVAALRLPSLALLLALMARPGLAPAADVSWNNPAGGNWGTAANWTPATVPGAGDTALITLAGTYSVTLNTDATVAGLTVGGASGTQTLQLGSSRTLTLTGPGTVGTRGALTLSSGTLTGAGDLGVQGALTLSGGIHSGAGTTAVAAGGTLSITGSTLSGRRLECAGTATWASGTFLLASGAELALLPGGSLSITAAATMDVTGSGAAPRFESSGSITRSGTGTTTIDVVFDNAGTLSVSGGKLSMRQGGDGTGTASVAAGAELSFSGGTHDWTASSSVTGSGTVSFASGTANLAGTYDVTGMTRVTGGTVRFLGAPARLGGVEVTGGTLDLQAHGVSVPSLSQSAGTLDGTGTIGVTGNLTLSGGTQSGVGTTELLAGGTLLIEGITLTSRRLEHGGSGQWTSGNVVVSSGAVVHVRSGATLDITANATMDVTGSGTPPRFENDGSVTRSGTGTTTIQAVLATTGPVSVTGGTLAMFGGGTSSAATSVSAGATVSFTGGTADWGAASSLAGAGVAVFQGGTTTLAGTYDITGTTRAIGGTGRLTGTVLGVGNVEVNSGTLDLTDHDVTVGTLTQQGGVLNGTGTVTVNDALLLSGGSQTGIGTTRLMPGGSLTIEGTTLASRRLENHGTGQWTSGNIVVSSGAVVENRAGATLGITANATLDVTGSGVVPRLVNDGALSRSGTGTTTIQAALASTGPITVTGGTLALSGGGTHEAAASVSAGATLTFGAGTHDWAAPSSLTGAGTVVFQAGTTTLSGSYDVSGTTRTTGGTGRLDGTLASLGALEIFGGTLDLLAHDATAPSLSQTGGTLNGTGRLSIGGPSLLSGGTQSGNGTTELLAGNTLEIDGRISLEGRTLENHGTARWTSGAIVVSNGAIFRNATGASLEITANALMDVAGTGTTPRFESLGSVTRSGTGTTTLQAAVESSGPISVTGGTLALSGGGTATGAATVSSGATLSFTGGTHDWSQSSSVTGAGNVTAQAGTVTLSGAYDVSGTTRVNGGTARFLGSLGAFGTVLLTSGTLDLAAQDATAARLEQQGGTLAGTGRLGVTEDLLLSGGSQTGAGTTELLPGGTLRIEGTTLTSRRLENGGAGEWTAGNIAVSTGAVLRNRAGATLAIRAAGLIDLTGSGPAPRVENEGAMTRSGTGTTTVQPAFSQSGTLAISEGVLSFTGAFEQAAGSTTLTGGSLRTSSSLQFLGGTLAGSGDITGNVVSSATTSPGTSPGTLRITGNFTQQAAGALAIGLAGPPAGGAFDALEVTGTASLAGRLDVTHEGGFSTSAGDSFQIVTAASVTGAFTSTTGVSGEGGTLPLDVVQAPTSVRLVAMAPLGVGATTPAGGLLVEVPVTSASGLTCLSRAEMVVDFDPTALEPAGTANVRAGCEATTEALAAGSLRLVVTCNPGTTGAVELVDLRFVAVRVVPSPAQLLVGCGQPLVLDCGSPPSPVPATCTESAAPPCVPGDIFPDGIGNRMVTAADYVHGKRKLLGVVGTLPWDETCGDVEPGVETCTPATGPASWCVTGNGAFTLADLVVIRRGILGQIVFGCNACDMAAGGSPVADRRLPGDVAPRAAPDGRVDVADAVVALRWAVGLDVPADVERMSGDVMPMTHDGELDVVGGDGVVDVADVVKILRAAVGLDRLAWPLRRVVARLEGDASVVAYVVATHSGWPAWAEPEALDATACTDGSTTVERTPDGWGVLCASDPSAIGGPIDLLTLRYRAPRPVEAGEVVLRWELLDRDLAAVPGTVVLQSLP